MKRWAHLAARLYPATWRARYGRELDVLLEDTGASASARDVWDIVRGAMTMQMISGSFWKIAAGFTIAGALVAGAWSLTFPDRYTSSAVLGLAASDPEDALVRLQKLQQFALSRTSLARIIIGQHLYENERARLPLEDIVQSMRNRDLRIQYMKDSQFSVSFVSDNPARAQAVVRGVVAALTEANVREDLPHAVNMEVTAPANLPTVPSGPNRIEMVGRGLLFGLIAGILGGAIWAMVRGDRQWSLKRVGAFAAGGAAIGITVALLIPDEYISNAVLRTADGGRLEAAVHDALSNEALIAIIQRERLYPNDVDAGPMDQVVEKMRNTAIRVQEVTAPGRKFHAFVVSFRYPDRFKAQRVTRALVAQITGTVPVEVLDPPSDPQSPSSPNRPQIVGLGVFAGVLLGLAATRFRRPATAAA